jgi:hypothetical protein
MSELYPTFNKLSYEDKIKIVIEKYLHLMDKIPNQILGFNTNVKVIKGTKKGFDTLTNYMTPYKTIYGNVCALAHIFNCFEGCLQDSGMGKFNVNKVSRFRKIALFNDHPEIFKKILIKDIEKGIRKSKKNGHKLGVRINGTSDIDVIKHFKDIIIKYPDVHFYDYTKIPKYLKKLQRMSNQLPNYHLTYSYSLSQKAQEYIKEATKTDHNIAMVFKNEDQVNKLMSSKQKIKLYGKTYNLINGDNDDLRFLDPKNSIVLLRYKETRASDESISNFVIDLNKLPKEIELV